MPVSYSIRFLVLSCLIRPPPLFCGFDFDDVLFSMRDYNDPSIESHSPATHLTNNIRPPHPS